MENHNKNHCFVAKLLRNPEKAIASSLGINFNSLINNWSDFYNANINEEFYRKK